MFDKSWKVSMNYKSFNVFRQTRELEPGEPMHSGVRETRGCFDTREEAQDAADKMNELARAAEALGYSNPQVDYKHDSFHRVSVTINGDEIGIYDFDRHTFVD
jgi:hypothetical protein